MVHKLLPTVRILLCASLRGRKFLVLSRFIAMFATARTFFYTVLACSGGALLRVGKGLDLVRMFYSLLPARHRWVEAQAQAAEFIIDETFGVPGVGTVVAGKPQGGLSRWRA
eukprot:GHRR01027789.1.p2 GENE.GHRR01027789.1~~GHRR01027789.1.p2  ORF type:complete len:125 (-),score=26.04 GHRR01027789.1:383-718(-)